MLLSFLPPQLYWGLYFQPRFLKLARLFRTAEIACRRLGILIGAAIVGDGWGQRRLSDAL